MTTNQIRIAIVVGVCACFGVTGAGAARTDTGSLQKYQVVKRIAVPGDGGWDLLSVDDAANRLYLSHSDVVQVVDEKTGALLGTVGGLNRVHGIVLVADLHEGFATCGGDTTVAVFDLTTLRVIKKIAVNGVNPDAILYEPSTRRVFAFNGRSNNATVIDAASRQVIGSVSLPGKPELATTDGSGAVFVNLEDTSMVATFDATALHVEAVWPLAPGKEPTGLAIDTEAHRLFSACNNQMMVVLDSQTGAVVATVPIGSHVDGAAFDAALKRAYAPSSDGTLTVIQEKDANSFAVIATVTTQRGARTIALDAGSHHVFLPTAEFGDTPPPSAEHPHPRPAIKPGSFVVLDVQPTD